MSEHLSARDAQTVRDALIWAVKSHIACPSCNSSDAGSITKWEDALWFKCFSCGVTLPEFPRREKGQERHKPLTSKTGGSTLPAWSADGWGSVKETTRGLKPATFSAYRVQGHYNDDQLSALGLPYFRGTDLASVKIRSVESEDKQLIVEGDFKKSEPLFGMSLFPAGGKYLTLTEGELDAMSAYQIQGSLYPCVSIKSGVSAASNDAKAAYEYLLSFERVIICFDADEAGQKAAKEVAEVIGKTAYIMTLPAGCKDANEALTQNKRDGFVKAFWAAKSYTPDGVFRITALKDTLGVDTVAPYVSAPFNKLDTTLSGFFRKRLITVCAGTGIGKSTFMRQAALHIWKALPGEIIGMAFLEESVNETLMRVIGSHIGKSTFQPGNPLTEAELEQGFNDLAAGDRFVFWDHFDSLSVDLVIKRLRYMHTVQGCTTIFLDHLGIVVSGDPSGDERKTMDALMTELRHFVEATGVTLFVACHLRRPEGKAHEEGAEVSLNHLRSSGGIAQLSDIVLALQRNQQESDSELSSIVELKVLKNRVTGRTGKAGQARYEIQQDRLVEIDLPPTDEKDVL